MQVHINQYELIHEEMVTQWLLWVQLTVMMEIQMMEMDAVVHVQLKLDGRAVVAAQHHRVFAMIYVGTVKE
jgi:hypothetical protein